jgi:DNA replication protein DnaC
LIMVEPLPFLPGSVDITEVVFGMRKLPHTAAEDLLEIVMRRYERFSTPLTSNRPVEDRGKLLGDVAAVSAMLDRLLHHGHILKGGPRSWRTKTAAPTT